MNATEDRVRYLKNEISAFESRLAGVKSDVEGFRKQKETLETQIEEAKARHNREVEEKLLGARKASALVDEERSKLEIDKKEFESILVKFKQEKTAFEHEKQTVQDAQSDAKATMDRLGMFIRVVRQEAEKL